MNTDKDWWKSAVIYQIYPRSFRDANGDGIGDLLGIIERMPYIADLGVDAIWISPFFRSPMDDFGYDVSDYRDIDPMFGTLADFDRLLECAHGLGIRVLVDLVISHTSEQHSWFAESRLSPNNPKSDWYVWADAKPDGSPPNNWLSIFGGSAWQWNTERRQYYLHNFLSSQPDLNFHKPEVQDAVLDITRFWLDRGVDGFRLDTINFYFCDQELRDNPPLELNERNDSIAPEVNPYNYQNHLYDKNQPENLTFLNRFRKLLDEYPAATSLGEVGDSQLGLELISQYTSGNDHVHMCYAFDFLSEERLDAKRVVAVVGTLFDLDPDSSPCWAFSNHDVERHMSRWGLNDTQARTFVTLLLSLEGAVCLYQGEELGLGQAELAFEELKDPYGIQFWPKYKGRDGCRTPMVWQSDAVQGGFSQTKPWLPVFAPHLKRAVDQQENNATSLLNHYRATIALRKSLPALGRGKLVDLSVVEGCITFRRQTASQMLFVAINLSETPAAIPYPDGRWCAIEGSGLETETVDNILLGPSQAMILEQRS